MCKNRRKNQKIKLGEIGKEKYDFDFLKEKNVYSYLSYYRMDKKYKDSLTDELKFDSYKKWETYVEQKYENYDVDKLEEFNRYLNLSIRNTKYSRTYWGIVIPVLLAVLISPFFEIFMSIFANERVDVGVTAGFWELCLAVGITTLANLFVILILVAGIVFIIFYFIEPLSVNNVDYYFLTDYKEIIEDLINKKKSVKCITYKSEEL